MSAVERVLQSLVTSAALREAMLGDLAEHAAAHGAPALWREVGRSLPSLLRARLLEADMLATISLALITVAPLLVMELLCAYTLSLVPLKASAARPVWFMLTVPLLPAMLATVAARARAGAPALWMGALFPAALLASSALPWPIAYRAWAVFIITFAGRRRPRRISA
ncbi:MAG: hypothetical protein FJW31_14050 [Acidobacteria bacterium]|nr:hypothetical protein [Acidobacteriota bacterium]